QRITVKLLQQVEGDMRLVLHQGVADYVQLIVKTDGINLVAHLLQRRGHVVFSFDFGFIFVGESVERVGRDEVLVHQDDNAQFLFRLESHATFSETKGRRDDNPNAARSLPELSKQS